MQLKDLVKPISEMTDDELRERLRQIRHSREVVRPAAKKIVERAAMKVARKKVSVVDKLLESLSPEEIEQLLNKEGTSE